MGRRDLPTISPQQTASIANKLEVLVFRCIGLAKRQRNTADGRHFQQVLSNTALRLHGKVPAGTDYNEYWQEYLQASSQMLNQAPLSCLASISALHPTQPTSNYVIEANSTQPFTRNSLLMGIVSLFYLLNLTNFQFGAHTFDPAILNWAGWTKFAWQTPTAQNSQAFIDDLKHFHGQQS